MLVARGDNHTISARDGLAVCEVFSRPDLTAEQGARNAKQMVDSLSAAVLRPGQPFRGIVFDVRRGPPVFGPKTRGALAELFSRASTHRVALAVLVGDSAIQMLQFRNLCLETQGGAEVFTSEADAMTWLNTGGRQGPGGAKGDGTPR